MSSLTLYYQGKCNDKDRTIEKLRRAIDNIKVRAYEQGQKELHDMALAALQEQHHEQ